MDTAKITSAKFFISVFVPLIIVTFGGLIVYQTPSAFFSQTINSANSATNGPAVIYFGLTLVIALLFFLMRQGYKGYEFVAIGVLSLAYSLSMQKMTPAVFRPVYVYIVPLLVFFMLMWLIMRFVFLNRKIRQLRLIVFVALSSVSYILAYRLQFILLKQLKQSIFSVSGIWEVIMFFTFLGFGLSLAEFIIIRLENKEVLPGTLKYKPKEIEESEDDD